MLFALVVQELLIIPSGVVVWGRPYRKYEDLQLEDELLRTEQQHKKVWEGEEVVKSRVCNLVSPPRDPLASH